MNLINVFDNQVNGIETDFRAEIIAAEMIENNLPSERILIVPLGAMSRPQNKDVASIVSEISDYDNKEYILIKTHKEGLYDKLPEGLFHGAISQISNQSDKQIIDAIKLHRKEEKEARLFFLPLDAAFNSLRVLIALYEKQLDQKFHHNELVNIFSGHWEIFKSLNVRQANVFLQVLPILHTVRDDWPAIENIVEQMFLVPAKISMRRLTNGNAFSQGNNTGVSSTMLGEGQLGVDMITGDIVNEPGSEAVTITFGPLDNETLQQFTGTAAQEKVALQLLDYLLPADADVIIVYDLLPEERSCRLGAPGTKDANCSMGISTYL